MPKVIQITASLAKTSYCTNVDYLSNAKTFDIHNSGNEFDSS